MAIADAISSLGGIATIWQTSFYGFKNFECQTNTDIMFLFSKFDSDINKIAGSKNSYNVITGLQSNDNIYLLKNKAKQIKNNLLRNGAKKIVCIMDENSSEDSRWHTGHDLQKENYSFILEKVLEIPWLGVVFKPKKSNTLRKRLGSINNLLMLAEATGRCVLLEESGKYVSSIPAILGGLIADVTIHGHLSAGTAAIECASLGKPTLLIDREGTPFSKLSQLPEGSVVFKDWGSALIALINYFKNNKFDSKFGDWTTYIKELDPFDDGRGTYRMSTYISSLFDGFNQGLDREKIMTKSAEIYARKWGHDKIITNG